EDRALAPARAPHRPGLAGDRGVAAEGRYADLVPGRAGPSPRSRHLAHAALVSGARPGRGRDSWAVLPAAHLRVGGVDGRRLDLPTRPCDGNLGWDDRPRVRTFGAGQRGRDSCA